MKTKHLKGPAIFLAQFMDDRAPFHSLDAACQYMASLGYKAVQIPTWDARCFDLEKLAKDTGYCHEIQGIAQSHGMVISELSAHLQGQLVATHPAYETLFAGFGPTDLKDNAKDRQHWAVEQMKMAIRVSHHLGLDRLAAFSGALLWPFVYPWPQRPAGLVETAFDELAKRWLPILDFAYEHGVDVCFELHPGEDLHDGITFERFLEATGNHPKVKILYDPSHFLLQCLDYVQFIHEYHEWIKMFHVKDAEFRPSGKAGVYGSYSGWAERSGRFRSPGDGQVDFKQIFSLLTQYGYDGWAVVEWECAVKSPDQGAREGASFVTRQMIETTTRAFDDFAGTPTHNQEALNKKILGLQ